MTRSLRLALAVALLFGAGCGDSNGDGSLTTNLNTSGSSSASGGVRLTFMYGDPISGHAETDRDVYTAADTGVATFLNSGSVPIFLPGCAPFVIEQRLDGSWALVGPPFVCVWEGIAYYLGMNRTDSITFTAPSESGVYRLRYDYSTGCDEDVPLSEANCSRQHVTYSNVFEVERELCDPSHSGCRFVPGAPNILCADGVNFSGPSEECTHDPETWECGYEFLSCP